MRGRGIWELLSFWVGISNRYERIRMSGNEEKSIRLAVESILYSIFGNLIVVGCIFFARMLLSNEGLEILIFLPLAIIIVLAAVIALVRGIVAALVSLIYQFRLNRGPMSWVALVVFLLSLVAAVIVSLFALGFFGELMN